MSPERAHKLAVINIGKPMTMIMLAYEEGRQDALTEAAEELRQQQRDDECFDVDDAIAAIERIRDKPKAD